MATSMFFFFFQAEDGIRDADVTGVQTCALPISRSSPRITMNWLRSQRCSRAFNARSEEHTSELQSRPHLVCRLLLEKKKELTVIDIKQIFDEEIAYIAQLIVPEC